MFKTYLKTAVRSLKAHRSNSVINVAGLMFGFAAFLLIFLVVQYEESFDTFHTNKNQLYRVVRIGRSDVNREYRTGVPLPVTQGLRNDLPQLKSVAAIMGDNDVQIIVTNEKGNTQKKFKEPNVFIAEPSFFQMFDFGFAAGDKKIALTDVNTVVLTKDVATKYFGDWRRAINQTLKLYGQPMKVTGVLNNPPANTDFPLSVVVSYTSLLKSRGGADDWGSINDGNYCFVQLQDNASFGQLSLQLDAFTEKRIKPVNPGYVLGLQPLQDIHYDERYGTFTGVTFSKDLILALRIIGLFLLTIACVNFINITTAHAINRSREVGVRKVLGSSRSQLVYQFLGETGIISFLAMAGSILVVSLCLPLVNQLLDIHLTTSLLFSSRFVLFMLASLVAVIMLSGLYPAMVLSNFKPIYVLKGVTAGKTTGISMRRGLVVFQFAIAQVLIIGTLVIATQMDYFRKADMGFNKEAVINASFPNDSASRTKIEFLKNSLAQINGVKNVSLSMFTPAAGGDWATDLNWGDNSGGEDKAMIVQMKPADTSFFRLYDLKILAGRPYFTSDTVREFVVNETVVRNIGIQDVDKAIGKIIRVSGRLGPIVGVVNDYHTFSLRDAIGPTVMTTIKGGYRVANIRVDMKNLQGVIAAMQTVWNNYYPDYVFEYNFLDQSIARFYQQEKQLSTLYQVFSAIAIFISCLGLYGLISFMAIQRRKEIGIRKVLGAPVGDLVVMLAKEFMVLIVIAFLVASPIAWYYMHQWLQQYTYRIPLGAWFFAATIIGSLCIAWLTVGYTAVKAALANPVKSLRSE